MESQSLPGLHIRTDRREMKQIWNSFVFLGWRAIPRSLVLQQGGYSVLGGSTIEVKPVDLRRSKENTADLLTPLAMCVIHMDLIKGRATITRARLSDKGVGTSHQAAWIITYSLQKSLGKQEH